MAAKIVINAERCKGCGLCVLACARQNLVIGKRANKLGYFPVECTGVCAGCTNCAVVCPDVAIEIYREEIIEEALAGGQEPGPGPGEVT